MVDKEDRCPNFEECEEWRHGRWYWGFCYQDFAWPRCPLYKGNPINPSSRYLGMETFLNNLQLDVLKGALEDIEGSNKGKA